MTTMRMPRTGHCAHEGCKRGIHARGLCNLHYRAALRPSKQVNLCACGCGEKTEYKFKHGHHTRLFSSYEQSRRGRCNNGDALRGTGSGYVKRAQKHEHRQVAEQMLGRPLSSDEVVHHKNGDKADNRPENLEVLSRAEHIRVHMPEMQERLRARRSQAA